MARLRGSDIVDSTLTGSDIQDGTVVNADLADMAQSTIKGRAAGGGTGVPQDLTAAQVKTILDLTGTNSGDQTITLTGDVTGSGTGSFAATIANDAVTNAKLANMSDQTIKGNNAGSTGDPLDLTVAQVKTMLSLTGTNSGDQTITLTGDVTGSGTGSFAATIANDAVTYAKMQNVSAASKLLGRGDSGSGDVQEITLGSGLTMTGTTLAASGGGGSTDYAFYGRFSGTFTTTSTSYAVPTTSTSAALTSVLNENMGSVVIYNPGTATLGITFTPPATGVYAVTYSGYANSNTNETYAQAALTTSLGGDYLDEQFLHNLQGTTNRYQGTYQLSGLFKVTSLSSMSVYPIFKIYNSGTMGMSGSGIVSYGEHKIRVWKIN